MLRSPKRKLREITLLDPRNAFPRFDGARSRRSAKKSMLRSPKRKLRGITLLDPRNAFPRFDGARSRRSAKKSMLRSPKRKLRGITLFDPRNAFPRLTPRASWISVSLSAIAKGTSGQAFRQPAASPCPPASAIARLKPAG